MTIRDLRVRWLLSALLSATATAAIGGCSEDKDKQDETTGSVASSPMAGGGSSAVKPSSDPDAAAHCPDKTYSALSDGCKECACGVDPQLAPSCQKPCWDFLACSFVAQAGKCASFAAGGAAMRPQFEACTMDECGAKLAVPGAEVVSSYRSIIGACAVPMGDAKPACGDDVAKFMSEL